MSGQSLNKPTSLALIGTFFISVSVFSMFSSIIGLLMKDFYGLDTDIVKNFQLFPDPINIFMEILSLAYYLILFVSSVQFLRLRAWARTSLEKLTWIFIVWTFIFGFLAFLPIENEYFSRVAYFGNEKGETFGILFKIVFFTSVILRIIFGGVILKFLRSETIRNSMNTSTTMTSRDQSF